MVARARSASGPWRMLNNPTGSGAKPWASGTAEGSGTASTEALGQCADRHHGYPPNSGPNVESNIETPPETIREGPPVNTTLTTRYISRGARIRTGDLLLPKLLLRPPIFTEMA